MMISRNGVYYDLSKSDYKYSVNGITFVFSSLLHLQKFKKKYKENRIKINSSLTNRFGMYVDVSALADMVLYKKIETRGFLVVCDEGYEIWEKEHIIFGGGKMTKRN